MMQQMGCLRVEVVEFALEYANFTCAKDTSYRCDGAVGIKQTCNTIKSHKLAAAPQVPETLVSLLKHATAHHGGAVWLEELLAALHHLAMNEACRQRIIDAGAAQPLVTLLKSYALLVLCGQQQLALITAAGGAAGAGGSPSPDGASSAAPRSVMQVKGSSPGLGDLARQLAAATGGWVGGWGRLCSKHNPFSCLYRR